MSISVLPKAERALLASAKHYNTPLNWATRIRNKALQRSKEKNIEFDLRKEFLLQKVIHGKCEATGLQLDFSGGSRKPMTPSLDRVDPNFGYTENNVQLVSCMYNFAKNTFTHNDVIEFCKQVTKECV